MREPQLHTWKLKNEEAPLAPRDQQTVNELLGIVPAAPPEPGVAEPGLLYPFGETEFAYLKGEIEAVEAGGLPETGGTVTGTITIAAETDPHLDLQGRYEILTNNAGTTGHTVSGPNLIIHDAVKDVDVVTVKSIGQLLVSMSETDANLADDAVAHTLQLSRVSSDTGAAVGFGTGVQVFLEDSAGTQIEAANLQVDLASVTPDACIARWVCRAMIGGSAGVDLWHTTSVGNLLGAFKILATGGLGAGNSVAATTLAAPGTVIARLPIFDAAGALLGSVPVYSAGSFS